MQVLYNPGKREDKMGKLLTKAFALCVLFSAITAGISCRKGATAPAETGNAKPAATAISEADSLYEQRSDLVKVRQGIVTLRQAQADHPTDFDLAWRLAKFNYYHGAHSPQSHEQEKAFADGTEAGKLAVQLQNNKPEGHFWLGANYGGSAK